MMQSDKYVDVFRQEADERLAEMEEVILLIEADPDDFDAINRLFRAAHTIKGSAAMYGFAEVTDFTHHLETVLEKVRERVIPVGKELIDLVLAARDHVIALLKVADGGAPVDEATTAWLVERLRRLLPEASGVLVLSGGSASASATAKPAAAAKKGAERGGAGRLQRTLRIVFRPERGFFRSGSDPALLIDELATLGECKAIAQGDEIPPFEDFDPEQCYFYWYIVLETSQDINAVRDVFIFVEDLCSLDIQEVASDASLDAEAPPPRLGEILVERGDASPEVIREALNQQQRIGDLLAQTGQVPAEKVAAALSEQEAVARQQSALKKESLRVPAAKLDSLVNLVGELVVNQARLSQIAATVSSNELVATVEEANRLAADLRDIVLNIRMMPIGVTFSRFTRLVRDLGSELGKDCQLITEGAETEMDKTVIDRLVDPLVHLIRNSLDHGIEPPAQRLAAGKPARGTIRLCAFHKGDRVVISVTDDGRGLDRARILNKALDKGLIPSDRTPTDSELFGLIFHPGFSTATEVTGVSGRGVGMDVVKREIASLRGSVDVQSQAGGGTTIALGLPLTLAIIDGLLVQAAHQRYVIPLSVIEECLELRREHFVLGAGRNVIAFRERTIPVVRLREVFELVAEPPPWEETVVTCIGGEWIGIVVDRVVGQYQTVIKSLGKLYQRAEAISGATILGDGDVALVLDIGGLMKVASGETG